MKKMKKGWVSGFLLLVVCALGAAALLVFRVDPFFHYHAPDTDRYFYPLDNQRSQNDGILRHFAYDGLITGTSMTENCSASEAERLFGGRFVKVCYEGSTFYETAAAIAKAAALNPELKTVIRGLDMDMLQEKADRRRTDLGDFPDYLYDSNWFNDLEYLLNRDVLFTRVLPMLQESRRPGFTPGITSFDDYSNWMGDGYGFGSHAVFPEGLTDLGPQTPVALTQEEADTIRENIRQNVVLLAREHPQITFYCFFPPYSAAWWLAWRNGDGIAKKVEAERIAIEEMLTCGNIRLFSFNSCPEITTNLNFYKDMNHYGEWINNLILRRMAAGKNRLTRENYAACLEAEYEFYQNYDYSRLIQQEDYADDTQAAEAAMRLEP